MARRSAQPPPPAPPAELSVEQLTRGIGRLQQCIADLEAFDPRSVRQRFGPEVDAVQAGIEEALAAVFGHGTAAYDRYRGATRLDNGPIEMQVDWIAARNGGPHGDDLEAVHRYLAEGKERALLLLRQAVRGLEREIALRGEPGPGTAGERPGAGRNPDIIVTLAERLHVVIRQLRHRHDNRPTLDVADEYDVQDLFHALLRVHFDDIRAEEWAPSYAGGASRMDFYLPEVEVVVEIKMTRPTLSPRRLSEELIVDRARYEQHPGSRMLFCVVYDPEGRIPNPRGVENDLTRGDGLPTRVMIVPR